MSNLKKVSLDLLRIFHAVAKMGSMTRGAQVLGVTQPAVSRSVQLLEEWIGKPLFMRAGRQLKLTQEGKIVFESACEMLDSLSAGQKRLDALGRLSEGTIHLGVTQLTLRYFLLPFLRRFHEEYPGVKIIFHTENMKELVDMVSSGQCDVAVVATPGLSLDFLPAEIDCVPLSLYHYMFIASRRYFPELGLRSLSFSELSRYPIVAMKIGTITRECFEQAFLSECATLVPTYDCDMMAMVTDLVRAGFGIGTVFSPVLQTESRGDGDLFEVPLRTPFPSGRLVLIRNSSNPVSPAVETLSNLILGMIG